MDDLVQYGSQVEDNWGFLERVVSLEPFEKKNMDFGLSEDERVSQLLITEKQLIVLTEKGFVFRQLYDERIQLQKIELPTTSQPIFGFFGNKYSEEPIERFFVDKGGSHCILQGKSEQVYYWHQSEQKIKKSLPKQYKDITVIAFDNLTATDQEVELLFSNKAKEFYFARISRKKQGDSDFVCQQLNVLPIKNCLSNIFIYRLNYNKSIYTCVLVCDDQAFNYFFDESNLENVFKKYEKSRITAEEIPIHQPGNLKICMSKRIGDNRPESLLYTTGTTLILLKFANHSNLPDDSFLKNSDYLRFGKQVEENPSSLPSIDPDRFTTNEKIHKIAMTEFHYFLLHDECLTVMNKRTQRATYCFKLGDMKGPVIDMIYDDSSARRSLLIYSRKKTIKISINCEEQYAFQDYLSVKLIEESYKIAKRNKLDQFDYVCGLYGDFLVEQGKFVESAKLYFQSLKSFEEIMLRYLSDERFDTIDGIIEYCKLIKNKLSLGKEAQQLIIFGLCLDQIDYKLNKLEKDLEVAQWEEQYSEKMQGNRDQTQDNIHIVKTDKGYEIIWLDDSVQSRLRKVNVDDGLTTNNASNINSSQQKKQNNIKIMIQNNSKQTKKSIIIAEKLKKSRLEYKELLRNRSSKEEQPIVYEIMQSHGRIDDCLNFAKEIDNYENVITHYINEQSYQDAISYLKALAQRDLNRSLDMAYKFNYILLLTIPQEFILFILKQTKEFAPSKLISGIMNIPDSQLEHGIKFLQYCVFRQKNADKIIHNLYLFFLVHQISFFSEIQQQSQYSQQQQLTNREGTQQDDPRKNSLTTKNSTKADSALKHLMEYLKQTEDLVRKATGEIDESDSDYNDDKTLNVLKGQNNVLIQFDLDFALRLFEQKGLTDAAVMTYALMNFYELAVKLALDKKNIDLAKEYASKQIQEDKRKKLWLKIAIHLIETQQSQSVLQLVKEKECCLTVEDLLPHFKEVHQVDLLKEQICDNLQGYNSEIEQLKLEVDTLNNMSDTLKRDINAHSHKFLQISSNHDCQICKAILIGQDHYLFPCMHGFHRNCIVMTLSEDDTSRNLLDPHCILNPNKNPMEIKLALESKKNKDDIQEDEKESISRKERYSRLLENRSKVLKKVIVTNQYLNEAHQDLKKRQDEAIQQIRQQLKSELSSNSQQSSSFSKFIKDLAFGNSKKEEEQIDSEILLKRISALNSKDAVIRLFTPEEREEFLKKQSFVDEYLSKECFCCGLSSVDKIHTIYSKKEQDWEI